MSPSGYATVKCGFDELLGFKHQLMRPFYSEIVGIKSFDKARCSYTHRDCRNDDPSIMSYQPDVSLGCSLLLGDFIPTL